MPNHVTNILRFEGDEEQIKALKEKIKGEPFDDGTPCLIDFSNIIPFPKELEGTRSPAQIVSQEEYDEWMRKYNAGELNEWEKDSKPLTEKLSKKLIKKYGANNWYDRGHPRRVPDPGQPPPTIVKNLSSLPPDQNS